ncbi:hypothetical protein Ciccas_006176 [Cichlidogyrus casuarinus]|uniref:Uncharacterized protein n=1 Tax=Cichlidogyrus casuarinus TaxID=1844966 RepID=A0ABD2Q6J8_9PLAT
MIKHSSAFDHDYEMSAVKLNLSETNISSPCLELPAAFSHHPPITSVFSYRQCQQPQNFDEAETEPSICLKQHVAVFPRQSSNAPFRYPANASPKNGLVINSALSNALSIPSKRREEINPIKFKRPNCKMGSVEADKLID